MQNSSMLSIKSLNIFYGNIHALRDISLSIEEGEIVALIGANGAGKSTLLKGISRILSIASGEIFFRNQNVTRLSAAQVVRLGISQAPEGRRVFPEMTVLENLEMGAFARRSSDDYGADLERVYAIFPILKERRSQKGETLSGGEQQMLTIGRALMARPRLLLLDEPSMGLAPALVNVIFQTIHRINTQGTTVLLVEQNAAMALSLAKRGYVLETGRLVMGDSSENLISHPKVRDAYLGKSSFR